MSCGYVCVAFLLFNANIAIVLLQQCNDFICNGTIIGKLSSATEPIILRIVFAILATNLQI
ncbi:hypothetical protein DMR_09410 [Solidesulfovibrio magneticus RS-1]|uniref:Uncharacterized protein n=1 Tax=Solidesulfovibrio magneticus (strain ATCC 700980 / DSM 13731 / RS-1) TaxID=573370 RepID=C4XKP1_SOLM1|nr:hypothetical protein DMR_09410 [Solidesulfovibrio magneticus RS-1]